VFFNDRKGILYVRATLQDLDIIEQAIQTLNITPPQVNIQSKIAEVTQDDRNSLGFNWFLGNTLMRNGGIGLQGGTAPTYNGVPTLANPEGTFPGSAVNGTSIANSLTDGLITQGLRNGLNAPAIGTLSGILTDPQFRLVIKALEQRDGVDVVSAPSVTTLSGRQTHIEVTDIISVVTDLDNSQTGSGGNNNNNNNNNGNNGGGAVGSTITPIVEQLPFGPSLDVIPSVSADEYSIQMTIIPTITEFVGYDTSTFSAQAQGSSGNALVEQVPLPRFRVRQVTTSVVVWDGQTVVLGGLITESVIKTKDKVPVMGDLPLVGRLFRSESASKAKKNLLIFVTPTIIDPAGNRVHLDEDMPFAKTSIPPQRPVAPQP
jgi:general secretion pathway protein D